MLVLHGCIREVSQICACIHHSCMTCQCKLHVEMYTLHVSSEHVRSSEAPAISA
jgi:hypothetical protein